MRKYKLILLSVSLLLKHVDTYCQVSKATKYENVVYGMVSGTALLMDIHMPVNSNHIGILFIPGSGFGYFVSEDYDQSPLKNAYISKYPGTEAQSLVNKGYTVFIINHRNAPKFRFPEIFYDCQRAVRFIRYNATKYGIDPNHIGAMGHSSGGNLSAMLGVQDTTINKPKNPIDNVSSKVQTVVTLAGYFDLSDMNKKEDTAMSRDMVLRVILNYMGELPQLYKNEFVSSGKYAQASPLSFISKDDAPFLIYYSDDDPVIPAREATLIYQKLKENNVPVKIVLKPKEGHLPKPDMEEVDKWFKQYLKL